MNDLLNVQNVTVVGLLLIAVIAFWKKLIADTNKQQEERRKEKQEDKKERQEMYTKLDKKNEQMYTEEKDRHVVEEKELKLEITNMHQERKVERKEWLNALNSNTKQLRNVADKLEIIPNMQKDIDYIQQDIKEIKNKLNK